MLKTEFNKIKNLLQGFRSRLLTKPARPLGKEIRARLSPTKYLKAIKNRPFKSANSIILILILIMIFLTIQERTFPEQLEFRLPEDSDTKSAPTSNNQQDIKSLSHYLEMFDKRELFKSTYPVSGQSRTLPKSSEENNQRILERISLIGIISGDISEAIIQVKSTGETHHYKIGDLIDGLFVKSIENSRVVLSDSVQEYLLTL